MTKVLITGANGQVGRAMVAVCQQKSWQAIPCTSQDLDIRNPEQLEALIQNHQPDYIVNCAAYTKVAEAEESDQAVLINANSVGYLAKICQQLDIPLFHFSTDYVFDGTKPEPYVEIDATHPLNAYGDSKCQGEEQLRANWHKHIILRVSWVFAEMGHNFIRTMISLKDQEALSLPNDQLGSPTAARHIAEVVTQLIQHPNLAEHFGTYHYTDAPVSNWYEFATIIFNKALEIGLIDKMPVLTAVPTNRKPSPVVRPLNSRLNCHKLKATFGIEQANWETELDHVLALLKKDSTHV